MGDKTEIEWAARSRAQDYAGELESDDKLDAAGTIAYAAMMIQSAAIAIRKGPA